MGCAYGTANGLDPNIVAVTMETPTLVAGEGEGNSGEGEEWGRGKDRGMMSIRSGGWGRERVERARVGEVE